LLSSPQNTVDRLTHLMGTVTAVPLEMCMLSVREPDDVRSGVESGSMSSSVA